MEDGDEDDDDDDDDNEGNYLHPSLFASKKRSRLEELMKVMLPLPILLRGRLPVWF